jgi:hypothetical protein
MSKRLIVALSVLSALAISAPAAGAEPAGPRVGSDQMVTGFPFPESVGCDAKNKVLYVSLFVSALKPAEKDGQGKISKVSTSGKILEDRFLPAHGEKLHKPKGIWVSGNRLWVTDIDAVWIFDLKTRKGRKLELKGITFANDPAVLGSSLYVSDNRADQVYRVEPADFLNHKGQPQVSVAVAGKGMYPNGLYPARDGSLLIVGFQSAKEPRGIYQLDRDGAVKVLAEKIGRLDGIHQMRDGSLLVTDWDSGSLSRWSAKGGMQPLAKGFKGPADFCVIAEGTGMTVVVPDLVQSQLRFVKLVN